MFPVVFYTDGSVWFWSDGTSPAECTCIAGEYERIVYGGVASIKQKGESSHYLFKDVPITSIQKSATPGDYYASEATFKTATAAFFKASLDGGIVQEAAVGVEYEINRISAEGYQWYRKVIAIPDMPGAGGSQYISFGLTLGTHYLLVGAGVFELNGNFYPIPNSNPAGLNYAVGLNMSANKQGCAIAYGSSFDGNGGLIAIEYTKE